MLGRPQNEQATAFAPSRWAKLPISLRAIVSGLFLAIVSLNVWPVLLAILPMPLAALAEAAFLLFFLWWAGGGGPPHSTKSDRAASFRSGKLSVMRWVWGLSAALFFAVTVHASIVLLFRVVPFPVAAFRNGYDLSFIHSQFLKWTAILISAVSAGICEEIGFRGYMQQPIEQRSGVLPAVHFVTFLHGCAPYQGLGDVRNDSDCVWRRAFARAARLVRALIASRHNRSHHDGHRPLRLLVDGPRRGVFRANDQPDWHGPLFPHRVFHLRDLVGYRCVGNTQTQANASNCNSIKLIQRRARHSVRLA